ncbi:uncharacterized protein LOC123302146 [Chrysoperla carnea]|uniref:uncharacterized protein LOC123302146 n=1 Tax=Chrysoperla carnea TaxID=189513 RepID=UPI001D080E74|nr:uncharacterized protein LOC123302146 [Chrysoperla carnea]
MERQRDRSESETGESDTPGDVIPQNFNLPRPNSLTRTSSEEELTLLSENADPNVQDPHQRHSLFWRPSSTPVNAARRTRGSPSAIYIPPWMVRQNRPSSSRERYFSILHIMNQPLPYRYYRQLVREEIPRRYRGPLGQLRDQETNLLINEPMPLPLPAFAFDLAGNLPTMQFGHAYVAPQNSGMGESEIDNYTDLLLKQDETEDDMTCVICMSLTTKLELLRKLPCRHIFHRDCIDKWLGFNGICPTCRRNVRQSTPPTSH